MRKMAQTFPSPPPAFLPILLSAVVLLFPTTISAAAGSDCFTSIISFGDSIADTGNLCDLSPPQHLPHMCFPPYGNTFFHRPTGRSCDGRLIIDFIAEHLGLPLVPASFDGRRGDIATGVNFAVAGATALGVEFLKNWGVPVITTNVSLRVQLDLFRELMPSLCNSGESPEVEKRRSPCISAPLHFLSPLTSAMAKSTPQPSALIFLLRWIKKQSRDGRDESGEESESSRSTGSF